MAANAIEGANMFLISKIVWFLMQPINLLLSLLAAACVLLYTRRPQWGRRLAVVALLVGVVIAHAPVGEMMMYALEDRFPRPSLPARVDGIISLGGGIEFDIVEARGRIELDSAADRIVETVLLARHFPDAKVIYTGGLSNAVYSGSIDEKVLADYFASLGVEPGRLVVEPRSANTLQNAEFTRDLIKPLPDQTFLLVTSAFHMPRAMGTFRNAGWNVVAWPVDYRTAGAREAGHFFYDPILFVSNFSLAFKEYLGLFGYWVTGKTGQIFPAP